MEEVTTGWALHMSRNWECRDKEHTGQGNSLGKSQESSWTRDIVFQTSEFIHHFHDFCHIYASSKPLDGL